MTVLSLFNGMSCGAIALNRAGIKYDQCFSSEIDKHANRVTQINFPDTIQLGSVIDVKAADLPKIDLVLAGSPCQGFSNAGKGLNFEDPRSKLFFEFVRIWNEVREINPDAEYLLENVRMKKEWEDTISRILGIQPILINSALVSAQNRERLYWTNIGIAKRGLFGDDYLAIPQPKDKGIFLKDVLQPVEEVAEKYYISEKALARIMRKTYSDPKVNPDKTGTLDTKNNSGQLSVNLGTTGIWEPREFVTHNEGKLTTSDKANYVDANYLKGMDNHGQITMVREPIQINPNAVELSQAERVYDTDGKSVTLSARDGGLGAGTGTGLYSIPQEDLFVIPDKSNAITAEHAKKTEKDYFDKSRGQVVPTGLIRTRIRRLTPIEVCRLQTVPDDYYFKEGKQIISDSQIYRQCGNGWTIDVIAHILSYSKQSKREP